MRQLVLFVEIGDQRVGGDRRVALLGQRVAARGVGARIALPLDTVLGGDFDRILLVAVQPESAAIVVGGRAGGGSIGWSAGSASRLLRRRRRRDEDQHQRSRDRAHKARRSRPGRQLQRSGDGLLWAHPPWPSWSFCFG
jgi:hypothetical protein